MKKNLLTLCLLLMSFCGAQAETKVSSPDGRIVVTIDMADGGTLNYQVSYDGQQLLMPSPLGAVTNVGDYSKGLELTEVTQRQVDERYELRNIKQSQVHYEAAEAVCQLSQRGQHVMDVVFRVSNRDVAFRYKFYPRRDRLVCVVEREESHFILPDVATAFVCPQSKPMGGFARTSPSYETSYALDEPVGKNGWGEGYSFPCLFRVESLALSDVSSAGKSKVVNIGRQGAYKRGGTSVSDGMPITVKGNIQGTQGVTLFQSYIGFQQNLSIPGPVVQTSQRFIRILEFRPIRCRSNPPAHRSKGCFCYSIGKIDPFSPVQGNGVGFGNGSRSAVLEKEFESKTG